MPPRYEIRLARADGRSPHDAFGDLTVTVDRELVLLTGRLDQSALHGVLERTRALRWRLLEVRRARSRPGSPG